MFIIFTENWGEYRLENYVFTLKYIKNGFIGSRLFRCHNCFVMLSLSQGYVVVVIVVEPGKNINLAPVYFYIIIKSFDALR